MRSYAEYRGFLEGINGDTEKKEFISAITTNVTSFFREAGHFQVLADMIPGFVERSSRGGRIRIWSAACSSGEEPYSIAMTLAEKWPSFNEADLRVLATDIDPKMIAAAKQGAYDIQQFGEDPLNIIHKHTTKSSDGSRFIIADYVKGLIRFEELNLLSHWPFEGKFDVIFCRNVVIYFDGCTRQRLWRRLAERLQPGGTLFIGHSERIDSELERYLVPCGVTQYRRTTESLPFGREMH